MPCLAEEIGGRQPGRAGATNDDPVPGLESIAVAGRHHRMLLGRNVIRPCDGFENRHVGYRQERWTMDDPAAVMVDGR
jgi:hypothetical protein